MSRGNGAKRRQRVVPESAPLGGSEGNSGGRRHLSRWELAAIGGNARFVLVVVLAVVVLAVVLAETAAAVVLKVVLARVVLVAAVGVGGGGRASR